MTTELTEAQREHRRKQAHTAIAHAMYDTYGQQDTDRSQRIADLAMDALGDLAAEILADGTLFKALTIRDGVFSLEIESAREILLTLVASMRTMLDSYGAQNYLETEIVANEPSVALDLQDGQNPADSYTVTIQRRRRPTPHEFRQQAEARIADALTECDVIEAEQHGQHDEDADGMREAVRRIRAALAGGRDG
ncbi:hypothetical protein [Streptomyces sp. MBT28]|uniref:hypothetical protein n=1 Tax=Streptomyces sp. MBT28 TaxID=1488357 RepID=UPI0006194F22|nr:hypothetical protein [Streptomyces sp. MBT28]